MTTTKEQIKQVIVDFIDIYHILLIKDKGNNLIVDNLVERISELKGDQLSEKEELYKKLADCQNKYIQFLGEAIVNSAAFLYVHRIQTSAEDVATGEKYRTEIKELMEKINS